MGKKQPIIFSTKQYHRSVNVNVQTLEFNHNNTRLSVQFSHDAELDRFIVGEKATFGFVQFSGDVASSSIEECLKFFFSHIIQNYSSYVVKFPPLFYFGDFAMPFHDTLNRVKFGEMISDSNQSVIIGNVEPVINGFSSTNRRIYRKLQKAGFNVYQSESLSEEGYVLLDENRRNRNVKLSVSYKNLQEQVDLLKDKFHFFECRDENNNLTAYAVTLRLADDWLYVFYWGEKISYRKQSPVVYLAAKIMKFCQFNQINRLDAGISSLGGQIDEGLYEFKRRLGFHSCPKITIKGNT